MLNKILLKLTALASTYALFASPFITQINAMENREKITIPYKLGEVTSRWEQNDKNSKLIIHIKDAHCDYESQINTAKIIESLIKKHNITLVGLEGADSEIDTSLLSAFPDAAIKEKVCDKFIKKGILTGSESLSIVKGDILPFTLWGIENKNLYLKNFAFFRETIASSVKAAAYLDILNANINMLRKKIYPDELYKFEVSVNKHLTEQIDLTDWLLSLKSKADIVKEKTDTYKNLSITLKIIENESKKPDQGHILKEQSLLMSEISKTAPREESMVILKSNMAYQLGEIPALEYFNAISKYLRGDVKKYSALNALYELEKLKNSVDKDKLFDDLDSLEGAIRAKIAGSSGNKDLARTARRMNELVKWIALNKKMITAKFTDKELYNYINSKGALSPSDIIAGIKETAETNGIKLENGILSDKFQQTIDNAISTAIRFYSLADRRSAVMVNNMIAKMDKDKQSGAVIVSGGFHTLKIETLLKEKGISYITITPKSGAVNNSKYMELMAESGLGLPYYATAPTSYIAFPVLFSKMVSDLTYFEQLKQDFAKELVTYGDIPIEQYRQQVKEEIKLKVFNKLVILAGLGTEKLPESVTVSDFVSKLSPESVLEFISSYDNDKINNEIIATGANPNTISYQDKRIFADYLLYLLELSVKITPNGMNEAYYLNQLILNSIPSNKSLIYASAKDRQNTLSISKVTQPVSLDGQSLSVIGSDFNDKFKEFAVRLSRKMQDAGLVSLAPDFTKSDITITDGAFANTIGGDIEDRIWFTMSLKLADGADKKFFVKSSRMADFETLGANAFSALNRLKYKYAFIEEQFADYYGFHVTDFVGDMDAGGFNPKDLLVNQFAGFLGGSVAETFIFGLIDRKLNNMRVMMRDNNITGIAHVDLTGALTTNKQTIEQLLEPFDEFLRKAKDAQVPQKDINRIIISFLTGFEKTLFNIQEYYEKNSENLAKTEGLSGSNRWEAALKRMNGEITNPINLITDIVNYINKNYQLDIKANIVDDNTNNLTEPNRIQRFVDKEKFYRLNPEEESPHSEVYRNRAGNFFIKENMNLQTRPVSDYMKLPSRILYRVNKLFSLLSGPELAIESLGGIVPSMYEINAPDGININGETIKQGLIQQQVKHIAVKELARLSQSGDTIKVKQIIDKYFDLQMEMWKRAVFDVDISFHNNYGFDNPDQLDLKCFDLGALIEDPLTAMSIVYTKMNFDAETNILSAFLTKDEVEHYKKRYNEVFTIRNFLSLWNTEDRVPVRKIVLNKRVHFSQTTIQPAGPVVLETMAPPLEEPQLVKKFIESQVFQPFESQDFATDMNIMLSKDGNYMLKTSASMVFALKSHLKVINYYANELGRKITANPLVGIPALLIFSSFIVIFAVTSPFLFNFFLVTSTLSLLIILLTRAQFSKNLLGSVLPVLTTIKIKFASKRLGGLIPPMYSFDITNGANIFNANQRTVIKSGLIQEKMPYTLKAAFKELAKSNDINKINKLIDNFFEVQDTMWGRGVFDIDFLSFLNNYGINSLDTLDVKLFDLGGITTLRSRSILGIIYESNVGKGFTISELKKIIPQECVDYYSQKFNETYKVPNLLKRWNKEPYTEHKPIDLQSVLLYSESNTNINIPQGILNWAINIIDGYLRQIGREGDTELKNKILEVFEEFFNSKISNLTYNSYESNKDIIVYMAAARNNYLQNLMLTLSLKLAGLSPNNHLGGLLMAKIQAVILNHISKSDVKQTDRFKNLDHLIEQSM